MAKSSNSSENLNELAEQAKTDTQAFGRLYDHFIGKIYSFFFHRTNNNKETAEDLTSQTFEKVLKNISKYNSDRSYFSTWIYSIAQNNLTDFYRKNKFRNGPSLDSPQNEPLRQTPSNKSHDSNVITHRNKKILNWALSKLSQKDQLAISFKYIEGYSQAETAKLLKCSSNAVGVRIYRATKKLRGVIKKYNLEEKFDL